mgnify:CR=1 FL=1
MSAALKEYIANIEPLLLVKQNIKNIHKLSTITKIVVYSPELLQPINKKNFFFSKLLIEILTGNKAHYVPTLNKTKFNWSTTLRGDKLLNFMDKLLNVYIPQVSTDDKLIYRYKNSKDIIILNNLLLFPEVEAMQQKLFNVQLPKLYIKIYTKDGIKDINTFHFF